MGKKGSKVLREGEITFEVPLDEVTKSSEVFYNPVMELPRDISIAVYRALGVEGTFLDALSASGVRALRVAKELGLQVTANDLNPSAVRLIEKNADMNNLGIKVENMDASSLMGSRYFDVIDVDPFGTPVPYLDAAIRSAKKFLSITATDTAVLCGTYPKTCWRRYMAGSMRTDFLHELGVRILAGYVIRMAARFDISSEPVFAHSKYHYYRLYFRMGHGADQCNKLLDQVGPVVWNSNKLGPVWLGGLWDRKLVGRVMNEAVNGKFNTQNEMVRLLEVISEEAGMPAFYFDVHKLCRSMNAVVPSFRVLRDKLREWGIESSRTHFSHTGLRARCSEEKIKEAIKSTLS